MSNLTVQLDGAALREATMQAMVCVLTPELKDKLIGNAITSLLAPTTSFGTKTKSPLEQELNQ